MKLNELTIKEAKGGLKSKKFSSVELTKACLEQIKKHNKDLNAFITVTEKEALDSARKADDLASQDQVLEAKSLLGIPIALKDLFSTKGIKTTAASNVLKDYIPQYDAAVVKKIKDAGAIIIGKTNCDAWAHGSSGENSDFGPTKNPWDKEYVPGGSSSGSAVSVASDMCIASTGTDTGGSIRLPASFNNVVGLKPTYGRVSRYGIIAMASSLDSIGHFTKTVEDSALFFNVTAGQDKMDATTLPNPVEDFTKDLNKGIKGLKIGIPKEFVTSDLDNEAKEKFEETVKTFANLGAEIIEISLPYTEYGIAAYYIIQPSEVSSNLARYDGIRYGNDRSYFGDEAKRRIMLGTFTLSSGYYDAYYKKAMAVRTLIIKDFNDAFQKVDALISPVCPTLPWKLGEKINDPIKMYMSDVLTVTANLAGIPGLSLPIGFIDGLPVGMQILGPQLSEVKLFQIGYAYEQATQWRKQKPAL
ncbi:MAG: aspartyl/glutamyl-tRNA amidotransferase subunit A [Candidatus Levybacteria bacterium RIFCSPLOWO2_12_FULL_37_14]|nr:MAG: Glutamyl-tRNA(Gln) amidotransferase subunit A [Candidatus Levybacteria bacterium GW2011_GWA1_37_16]KKQ42061.1 MAG: Glutamyl-tRNA(Gln) amidotransferase subunit A [Candidatus Levybacteria bacterium GW2011_GWB1_37_8]OGH50222.1 MAG: aspartyl/glutamyl-tRNA amidotransferase subunit A [Candidatus Levybacteria bacterium RIFCSPLOWO2_12_FULL_37_14]